MTNPSDDLLITSEGVDEGSAASTVEGLRPPDAQPADDVTPVQGGRGGSAADAEASPAPPVDMESAQARTAREAGGTGQQLEAGEG